MLSPTDHKLRALVDAHDWPASGLGPAGDWPTSLRTVVDLVLAADHPMCLAWGDSLTMIYNDAYAPLLGARHPDALGQPLATVWNARWSSLKPAVDRALAGSATALPEACLVTPLQGATDLARRRFSFSPVRDQTGRIGGVLNLCSDRLAEEPDDARLEARVAQRTAELRGFADHLLTVREDEKAHLARELHDELGAVLTAAKLDLARLRSKVAGDDAMLARIAQIGERLSHGIALKRRIVEDLRPSSLTTLGLNACLGNLCAEVSGRLDLAVHTDLAACRLSRDADLAVYRVVQASLDNTVRHARANEVRVTLAQEADHARLQVIDNGVGFAQASSGHGIAGMRFRIERLGGVFSIASAPGRGTTIDTLIPSTAAAP